MQSDENRTYYAAQRLERVMRAERGVRLRLRARYTIRLPRESASS